MLDAGGLQSDRVTLSPGSLALGVPVAWSIELRRELVDDPQGPRWREKSFHDAVMRENNVPIEILKAKFRGEKLGVDRKASWRFRG